MIDIIINVHLSHNLVSFLATSIISELYNMLIFKEKKFLKMNYRIRAMSI